MSTPRSLEMSRTAIPLTTSSSPVLAAMASDSKMSRPIRALPTVPAPRNPTPICMLIFRSL